MMDGIEHIPQEIHDELFTVNDDSIRWAGGSVCGNRWYGFQIGHWDGEDWYASVKPQFGDGHWNTELESQESALAYVGKLLRLSGPGEVTQSSLGAYATGGGQ